MRMRRDVPVLGLMQLAGGRWPRRRARRLRMRRLPLRRAGRLAVLVAAPRAPPVRMRRRTRAQPLPRTTCGSIDAPAPGAAPARPPPVIPPMATRTPPPPTTPTPTAACSRASASRRARRFARRVVVAPDQSPTVVLAHWPKWGSPSADSSPAQSYQRPSRSHRRHRRARSPLSTRAASAMLIVCTLGAFVAYVLARAHCCGVLGPRAAAANEAVSATIKHRPSSKGSRTGREQRAGGSVGMSAGMAGMGAAMLSSRLHEV